MADRRKVPRKPKPFRVRVDEILEDVTTSRWSTVRLALFMALGTFLGLSVADSEFRDPGAFVTITLALIGSIVAPKLLDLRLAIGEAAAAIGRRWTRKETRIEERSQGGGAAADVDVEGADDDVAVVDVDRSGEEQKP